MAHRHLARSLVMQSLFAFDYNPDSIKEALDVLRYNATEFAPGMSDTKFIEELLGGILKKRTIIDDVIVKAAPEWPLNKINAVDRNVLRLGLYELLFGDYEQVPPKVAINEAIELAKNFGGESSGRFVNGVLGAVYKEIGEPGKDQKSRRQILAEIPFEELPIEEKAGAIVYAYNEAQELHFAMVHDVFGYWTLSKGTVEEGETPEQAAVRELKEEINLDITIDKKLGENEYIANHPQDGRVRKQVNYFLGTAPYGELTLDEESGGLNDAKWFAASEIIDLNMYEDVTQLMTDAIAELIESPKE